MYVLVCLSQYHQALDGAGLSEASALAPRGCGKEQRGEAKATLAASSGWAAKEMFNTACRARCRSVPTIQGRRLRNGGDLAGIPVTLACRDGARQRPGPDPIVGQDVIAHTPFALCWAIPAMICFPPGVNHGDKCCAKNSPQQDTPFIPTPRTLRRYSHWPDGSFMRDMFVPTPGVP